MAFPRLPLKSHMRLLSPLSPKKANISTCSNVPLVNKVDKAKRLLDRDDKTDVFQRGRVRYRSFKNTREEKKLRSVQNQQIDSISTESRSKSAPLFHSIEDHLQPRKVVISTKKANPNSFSVLNPKNTADNRYVAYIQNQRSQLDLAPTKNDKQPKQNNTKKTSADDECDNLNDIINTNTENPVRYNLNKVKENINLHAECIKEVYDTVVSFRRKYPRYKYQSISTYRGSELKRNVEEIINFFQDLKDRVVVRSSNALTNESYSQRRYDNTTDFLQSYQMYESRTKENDVPIYPTPSSTTINIPDEISESDSNINSECRHDAPYKSYSEVLTEMLKSTPKANTSSGLKTWKTESSSPILSHHFNSDTNSSANFSQQKASFSNHALKSTCKATRIAKTEKNFSTSPTCFWVKCGKPPSKSKCDLEEEEKGPIETCRCVQPVNPECQPVCPEMPKTAPPLKRLKKVEIPEPKKVMSWLW
ncbi:uncharacterized protein LOC112905926 [Agrilus planipennis]|uniref:Uncharacterized protein LOC112905926 n=1 Tax=Agrilus planipennis TaxID=224129 RepID=A0A7F5RGM3_AGRPL|nr:uncharacterized protein LOC112905926 [Agrilus planipennis]